MATPIQREPVSPPKDAPVAAMPTDMFAIDCPARPANDQRAGGDTYTLHRKAAVHRSLRLRTIDQLRRPPRSAG